MIIYYGQKSTAPKIISIEVLYSTKYRGSGFLSKN